MAVDDAWGNVLALGVHDLGARIPLGRGAFGEVGDGHDLAVLDADGTVGDDAAGTAGPDGGVLEDNVALLGEGLKGVGTEGVPRELLGDFGLGLVVFVIGDARGFEGGPTCHRA